MALADSCFIFARCYYDQLYCEVVAKGYGRQLPSLMDFQANNETTQALLLKRPAQKAGISLKMPAQSDKKPARQKLRVEVAEAEKHKFGACRFESKMLACPNRNYQLLGNRTNKMLEKGALTESNQLNLPDYTSSIEDKNSVAEYLYKTYETYLQKMSSIGLAGSVMGLDTFAAIFFDLHAKGVSFTKRFETMFFYLKRDKSGMGVRADTQIEEGLKPTQCIEISRQWVLCEGQRAHVFKRSND